MSARTRDNERLLSRIREHHVASNGVMGMPRMHEDLSGEGETASRNRVARLMARNGLFGIPQRRSWRRKRSGVRPTHVTNHLERDFSASEPNTKWVTDITYIHTAQGWLYLCTVLDLYSHKIVGWSMSDIQDRHLVLSAVLMACWQRSNRAGVALGSGNAIYLQRLPAFPARSKHHQQHERRRALRRQRSGGRVLRDDQARAHPPSSLPDARRSTLRRLRLYRTLPQSKDAT